MEISKQQRQALETQIHQLRVEGGVRAIHTLLLEKRDQLNKKWPRATGEDTYRSQGEALVIDDLIRVIEDGPRIRIEQESKQ